MTSAAKPKPTKVHEPIWAYDRDSAGRYVWREATIVSRGGSDPHRVSVRYDGRSWQCIDEGRRIFIKGYQSWPVFCREADRPEIEARHREVDDRLRQEPQEGRRKARAPRRY